MSKPTEPAVAAARINAFSQILVALITSGILTGIVGYFTGHAIGAKDTSSAVQQELTAKRQELSNQQKRVEELEAQVRTLREENNSHRQPPKEGDPPKPEPAPTLTQEHNKVTVTMKSCKYIRDSVTCTMEILNRGQNGRFDLVVFGPGSDNSCRIAMRSGQYMADKAAIGNKSCDRCQLAVDTFSEQVVDAEITFPHVPPTDVIPVIRLLGGFHQPFEFSAIPVTK